ncbi:UDP-N-acetylmuramoyl-L-alanyl-D-glutamate--2,6-diaminopimelate ligase [Desulfuromonas sp. AOP6]|uniref:UDP-N-acetylmuramoyl-L-alanyl-D-glutamate--2, 6-diaminopimelate ligase n=1 Tax=Desulfuromonas sp. AOP6 TaxID=1566351 RepID=UPI00127025B8|nr:UDP-N-acetylmuramoyl-L-alanyl-D-glutamate--2,6-diaminopimelate ligase [Desulfuromonas sp. AOP6]BCA80530.1 UDP-N-acetylmuramoyl-L-alanyl-D-glutamate--2,6-diaminopimelate ligase [Desulfuromonas sp. AOP6]
MKLCEMIKKMPACKVAGSQTQEIAGLFYDSRQVTEGGAFFALPGIKSDGHLFVEDAIARGAVAIFAEKPLTLPEGLTLVQVENARQAMALAAHAFYGDPTADIPVVGVTGTNGKTTVTYLVEAILQAAGKKPAVFGTVNYRYGNAEHPSSHTTPESVDFLRTLAHFRSQGADALVLEVSSHALDQYRVEGTHFNVGIFTNLTPEHLDYHGDMEGYYASKAAFFRRLLPSCGGCAIINVDDPYGKRLAAERPEALTCGSTEQAAVQVKEAHLSVDGITARISTAQGEIELRSSLVGQFNLQNILCAFAAGLALKLDAHLVAEGIARAAMVPGRLERIENERGALILVDYAHTGDALDKVLATLQDLKPRRLVTVFGCGGDRDRSKRPVMGEVAARFSDLVVLTSDNPRTEDPQVILAEIRPGIERHYQQEISLADGRHGRRGFVVLENRRQAIGYAVSTLGEGDILLVAGKGHEDYQVIGTEKHHFDDREELRQALASEE